jgi:hypothetical protein
MRTLTVFIFILVFALCASAFAGDLYYVGKITAPSSQLYGLESLGQTLFAVSDRYNLGSCMYLINAQTGAVNSDMCFNDTLPVCLKAELNFKACAIIPGEDAWDADFAVADDCGAIIRYAWAQGELDTIQSFIPEGVGDPTGLTFDNDWYYLLDQEYERIIKIDRWTLYSVGTTYLPYWVDCPHGLTMRNGNFFIAGCESDSLWEIDEYGYLVNSYLLEGASSVKGLTWIGDSLYVAHSDTTIRIYTFEQTYQESVPTGDSVVVEVVPEGLEVAFDSVSTAGSLYVEVTATQPCPPPGRVAFFSDFYDVSTSAAFEYITEVTLMTDYELPEGVDIDKVRVFVRPSGECTFWRDITVEPTEEVEEPRQDPTLRILTRTKSEDDEFSVFVLGEDNRNPRVVAALKFGYLREKIEATQDSIPPEERTQINSWVFEAERAFDQRRYRRAIVLVDRIADLVAATPAIPHTYDPEGEIENVAGAIIGRAHTLVFTVDLLMQEHYFAQPPVATKKEPTTPATEFAPTLRVASNPVVSGVAITLAGRAAGPVDLGVYSVRGELVRTLIDGEYVEGVRSLSWDGRNNEGVAVATGAYYLVMRHGDDITTRKIILQR